MSAGPVASEKPDAEMPSRNRSADSLLSALDEFLTRPEPEPEPQHEPEPEPAPAPAPQAAPATNTAPMNQITMTIGAVQPGIAAQVHVVGTPVAVPAAVVRRAPRLTPVQRGRALLHADVVLPAVAALIVLIVLLAWAG